MNLYSPDGVRLPEQVDTEVTLFQSLNQAVDYPRMVSVRVTLIAEVVEFKDLPKPTLLAKHAVAGTFGPYAKPKGLLRI